MVVVLDAGTGRRMKPTSRKSWWTSHRLACLTYQRPQRKQAGPHSIQVMASVRLQTQKPMFKNKTWNTGLTR